MATPDSIQFDTEQSQRITLALCALAGVDPNTTTNITAELTAGDKLATIHWEGVARVDPAELTRAIRDA